MSLIDCRKPVWAALVCVLVVSGCQPDAELRKYAGVLPIAEPSVEWEPRTYVAYRAGTPLSIDGRLEEGAWQAAPWTELFVDIEGPDRPAPRYRTRAKMLWDSSHFFVGAELEEPHIWGTLLDRDAVIYLDNDFEVFIDPDGDTHEYYELEVNALGTEWDLLLIRPYRDGGPAIHAWDMPGLKTAVFVDGTLNDPSDTDRGWTVEMAFPWVALKEAARRAAPPESGDRWRVNFSRVEWRAEIENGQYRKIVEPAPGRTRPEDNWVWSPQGIIDMHYPEMWGIVQFSSTVAGQGRERFVPDPDDQAKWALRRIYYRQRGWFASHGSYTPRLGDLGLTGLATPGYAEPRISVAPGYFQATMMRADGIGLRITSAGRVRPLP